jgi:hypothetical protein
MHGTTNKMKSLDWPADYVRLLGMIGDGSFVVPSDNETDSLFVASPSPATKTKATTGGGDVAAT